MHHPLKVIKHPPIPELWQSGIDPVIEGGKMVAHALMFKIDKEIIANSLDTNTPGKVVFTPEELKKAPKKGKSSKSKGKAAKK